MNHTTRNGERQLCTASSEAIPALAFAVIGGALGGIALLLWLAMGWWVLALVACVFAAAGLAKVMARVELRRMTREIQYQRRTPWQSGVGQNLDVQA